MAFLGVAVVMTVGLSVIVDNLYVFGAGRAPAKADPELVVDPDRVLARPVADQCLQPVPRRDAQIASNCT
jgi:hypothetical protein